MRRTMMVLSVAAVTLLAALGIGQPQEPSMKPDRLVAGTVLVDPPGDEKGIPIAGFTISLRSGDTVVAQATTDEYGGYTFRNPAPGSYRLCWGGAAWKPNCREKLVVVVGDASVYVRPTRVDPNGMFLFGRVATGGKARVEARTQSGAVVAAVANALGQYVLAGLPDEQVEVTASVAEATTTRSAKPSSGGVRMDLLADPKQPEASPQPPPEPVCPKLSFFFNCPPGTPGNCDNPALSLNRLRNDEPAAKTYYGAVDPKTTRLTFAEWLKVAGFDKAGGGTRGFYTNNNDLGFGRDMHILETQFGVFAYVTNYAEACSLQHPGNAKLAHQAPRDKAIATVCMEWSAPGYNGAQYPGPDNDPKNRFVKFFVFGGDGARRFDADLDGNGPRFVPSLCINCHGGQEYTGSPNVSASFLPFDLDSFKFDGTPRYRDFRALNQLVRSSRPNRDIVELIDGWYPSGGDDVPDPFRPATWNERENRKKVYDAVVARSCRTCHVAFTVKPTWSKWDDFQFGDIEFFTANGLMPHAVITKMNMYSKERAHWPDEEGPRVLRCFLENTFDEAKMQECIDNP